jgi:hypothetical protein
MKQILTVVLRNQFNLFYRFGYTCIPKALCIEFEDLKAESTRKSLLKLFSSITPFEYDDEYLIVHLDTDRTPTDEIYHFDIQNVVAVYPFSQQAKVSIESRIDQRIKLEDPVFENILQSVDDEIVIQEQTKAIEALWHLCGFTEQVYDYISKIGKENISRGMTDRKNGIKANAICRGNYWEYLLAYDRYDYFPNSTLGYFYDAGQVFAYSKGRLTFEGSKVHKCLEEINTCNPNMLINDIIKALETNEMAKGYIIQTTDDSIKQYVVVPLFLFLRDELRKSDDMYQTSLFKKQDWLKQEFGESFKYVIILLSAFFGFRKFYDAYYDSLNLRFYKNTKKPTLQPQPETQTKQVEIQTEEEIISAEEAKIIFERLQTECPSVRKNKSIYMKYIQKFGLAKKLIDVLTSDKSISNGKKTPKNVIKFFEKEIVKSEPDKSQVKTRQKPKEKIPNQDLFKSSQLCWDDNAQSLFDNISGLSERQKIRLVKNLQYVQKKHRNKNDSNSEVIKHFINLCNYQDEKVPDFQSIEPDIREILETKYPN